MTALTGPRTHTRRAHLRLVTSDDLPVRTTVAVAIDPEPGPKDATELVGRFARLLPGDEVGDGVFSLGSL